MTPGKLNVKIKLQKIIGNLLGKLRKFYMSGTVIWKFLAVVKRQFACEQIFTAMFVCVGAVQSGVCLWETWPNYTQSL